LRKQTRRHGGTVVLSLSLQPAVRQTFRMRAKIAGVSMARYFASAVAGCEGRFVLDLPKDAEFELQARADAAGVSISDYVAHALAQPQRSYATPSAETARPITKATDGIARALDLLQARDPRAAAEELTRTLDALRAILRPLARRHDAEVRRAESAGAEWTG
jgi:hypothetical protein